MASKSDSTAKREREERKHRVLSQGTPSITREISDAVITKNENIFFVTDRNGTVPLDREHGFGLYFNDCRYLNGYALRVDGVEPHALASSGSRGYSSLFQLFVPDSRMPGKESIKTEDVGFRWKRILDAKTRSLREVLSIKSYAHAPRKFRLSATFRAEFEDIYEVRGLLPEREGRLARPRWKKDILHFSYEGGDGVSRSLQMKFSRPPDSKKGDTATFRFRVRPGESASLRISLFIVERRPEEERDDSVAEDDDGKLETSLESADREWLSNYPEIRSDSTSLNLLISRSLKDLGVLRSHLNGSQYFAAGVPWFCTLFGRDSLITAWQTLAFNPRMTADTLRLLAHYQADQVDKWRDEEPGKILHEIRIGELAAEGHIPHTPYYGTVDSPFLFVMLIDRYVAWTGDIALFEELKTNVERALAWAEKYGDSDGDGYIDYRSRSSDGLINQGWKDSGDAIVDEKGSLAQPPLALVEVQAYYFAAMRAAAALYRRQGERHRADAWDQKADKFRRRFNKDFWLEKEGMYALALTKKRPLRVASSNPAHALWCGIADLQKAKRLVSRLMQRDMFSGWGIRTLSKDARGYNPIGYHLGTVWPHDNAIAAAGFRRYGFDKEAEKIFQGIADAARQFEHYRLPELFGGFSREDFDSPVRFPVACHPQAWAAGSIPFLLETSLGFHPDASAQRLRLVRPVLPPFVDFIEIHDLRVGSARVSLRFKRNSRGRTQAEVLKTKGTLRVVQE